MRTFLALLLALPALAAGYRAGTARTEITPDLPVWLSGYAARTHPANHVLQPLWAKALAIDDGRHGRVVIVTSDVLGLPPEMADDIAARCSKQFGLRRDQLWLNTSHTHAGPVVWPNLRVIFDFNAEDQKKAEAYAARLADALVRVAGEALRNLKPVDLFYGESEAGFAINRRNRAIKPIDHRVPVLEVKSKQGQTRAVLFGYACHNTTITGEFYEVAGDYAGYAQATLEAAHTGAQAMFVILCGGDQNPEPRSVLAHAETHGKELAASVERVLRGSSTPVTGPIRTAMKYTDLALAPHQRSDFEAESHDPSVFRQRRAKLMLEGADRTSVHYPVQAIQFGKSLGIVALSGEVVVDYTLRITREHPGETLIVAGYSNGTPCYIPSERVLSEGGYEAVDSMIYYAMPGPFAAGLEDRIVDTVNAALKAVR